MSEVFGGELRSVLQRHGAKESATVEPFFSLQLDIQVHTVQHLLLLLLLLLLLYSMCLLVRLLSNESFSVCVCVYVQSEAVWTVQEAMEVLAARETVQMNSGTRNEVNINNVNIP